MLLKPRIGSHDSAKSAGNVPRWNFARVFFVLVATSLPAVSSAQPLRPDLLDPPATPTLPPPPLPVQPAPVQPMPEQPATPAQPVAPAAESTAGYLGLTADTVEQGIGAEVLRVEPAGPAEQALLRRGDVIQRCNGTPIATVADLANVMRGLGPGQEVKFEVFRAGQLLELTATLTPRPATESPAPPPAQSAASGAAMLGVVTRSVDAVVAARLGLPFRGGAIVESVLAGTPAWVARIPVGAVIVQLDDIAITSPDSLRAAVGAKAAGDIVNLRFYEGTRLRSAFVQLAGRTDTTAPDRVQRPELPAPAGLSPTGIDVEIQSLRSEIRRLQLRLQALEQLGSER